MPSFVLPSFRSMDEVNQTGRSDEGSAQISQRAILECIEVGIGGGTRSPDEVDQERGMLPRLAVGAITRSN